MGMLLLLAGAIVGGAYMVGSKLESFDKQKNTKKFYYGSFVKVRGKTGRITFVCTNAYPPRIESSKIGEGFNLTCEIEQSTTPTLYVHNWKIFCEKNVENMLQNVLMYIESKYL